MSVASIAPLAALALGAPSTRATRVIVIGVPGLRWDDISPTVTPVMWALASRGSVGALSVRAAVPVTCAADGWATLGAGNRAKGPPHGDICPSPPPPVTEAVLASVTRANDRLDFGAEIGALGAAVRRSGACVTTVGDQSALATGELPSGAPPPAAAGCRLHVTELPAVAAPRAKTARVVDEQVEGVTRGVGGDDLVLLTGLSETRGEPPHLHVVVAAGQGFSAGGRLVSPTTRRSPYVQLIDIAPTVLRMLGLAAPSSMTGRPMRCAAHAGSLAATVTALVDRDHAAQEQRRLVPPFFALLVVGQATLYLLAAAALRWIRAGGPRGRLLRAVRVGATAGAAALVATYLANLVPWWRASHPLPVVLVAVAAATVAITAIAFTGPWRHRLTGPPAFVATVTTTVLAADALTGARLQLSSLAGYSPLVAGRFAGFGNVAFAVFATAALLTAALLAECRSRRTAIAVVVAVGVAAVAVDGYPSWGDDFGGVLALIPAFAVLTMLVAGARVTVRRLVAVLVLAVLVVAAFSLADYARPSDQQTHLGRFVGEVLHGGAWTVVRRKGVANVALLTHSVLTLLVPLAVALLIAVLLRPWGGLRRAFATSPELRYGLVATVVMGVVGFFTNDSGVAIPALAMTVAIPLAIAAAVEALRRADPSDPAARDQVLP